MKMSDNSEAPQRANASRLVSTIVMNGIIYLVGLIVIIMTILAFLGLR
jgi:hypothetical protein